MNQNQLSGSSSTEMAAQQRFIVTTTGEELLGGNLSALCVLSF